MVSHLGIPDSQNTVSVKAINSGHVVVTASYFISPIHPDYPLLDAPIYVFLIDHIPSGKRVVFDLGGRKNPVETSTPHLKAMFAPETGHRFEVEKDVATLLVEGGISLTSIDAIILSHAHPDHTGDPSTFPPSTDLVVGPGFTKNLLPAYPGNPKAEFFESDIAGRNLIELSFENSTLSIAGLRAVDYFEDGSFYLLDTPGHCIGHMVGLARVTAGPKSTFVVLGGDISHHPGQLRPSLAHPCPDALFSAQSQSAALKDKVTPPLQVTTTAPYVHHDPHQAISSLSHVQLLDGDEDVFVILAHDATLEGTMKLFPEEMNGWKEGGWKEKTAWKFLEKGNPAYRFGPATQGSSV